MAWYDQFSGFCISADDHPNVIDLTKWRQKAALQPIVLDTSEFQFKGEHSWSPNLVKLHIMRDAVVLGRDGVAGDRAGSAPGTEAIDTDASLTSIERVWGRQSIGVVPREWMFVTSLIGMDIAFRAAHADWAPGTSNSAEAASAVDGARGASRGDAVAAGEAEQRADVAATEHRHAQPAQDPQAGSATRDFEVVADAEFDADSLEGADQSRLLSGSVAPEARTPTHSSPPADAGATSAASLPGATGGIRVVGSSGDDVLIGGDGNDTIVGDFGNDLIDAGDGNDLAWGNAGELPDALEVERDDAAAVRRLAGDQRAIPALLGRLKETTLKDRVVKYRMKGEDGKMQVKTLPEATKGQARQPQPAKF